VKKWLAACGLMLAAQSACASDKTYADLTAWLEAHADAPSDGLAPGIYGRDRLNEFVPYLPPGYYEEFDFDGVAIEVTATQRLPAHRSYDAATARFAGQATIGANGELENHTAGLPFAPSLIDQAPPEQAGYMAAWNHIYRWQHYGFRNPNSLISYIEATADGTAGTLTPGLEGGGTVVRHMTMDFHRVYLARLAMLPEQDYRLGLDDAERLFWKDYPALLDPHDVAGTRLVVERALDPNQNDIVNSYLPTERRVRRLSAKERADRWMGSSFTLDDFEAFSGRVMDYTWTFLARKVIPHVVDSREPAVRFFGPLSSVPHDRWQLRPCFVVEGVPRWDGHPYGRRVTFFDAETFSVALVMVFDRGDSLWKIFYPVYQRDPRGNEPAAPPEYTINLWRASIGIDLDNRTTSIARATVPTTSPVMDASQVKNLFSISNLTGGR